MSMAPVAAMISGNSSSIGAMKSKIQSIASPGPAVNPSTDIVLFTTTLPLPMLVSRTVLLPRTFAVVIPGAVMTLRAPGSHRPSPSCAAPGGVAGTVELLRRSLSPGGIMLVGEPYWRREPPDQATLEGCYGTGKEDWLPLPELIESFGLLGCDVVEMVLADQDSWDRYAAASWLNIRRWHDANPHDELTDDIRAELASSPARYARYR